MPNKTIYVAERDLPVYDRAQEVAGGNLSAAITQALQRYLEVNEADDHDLSEVSVSVGHAGMRRTKRFVGVAIARWQRNVEDGILERYVVYRTARQRFAVHIRRDWSPAPLPYDRDLDIPAPGPAGPTAPRPYRLEVYDTFGELGDHVPAELADLLEHDAAEPDVEDLDI